jgi:hypothetical protein
MFEKDLQKHNREVELGLRKNLLTFCLLTKYYLEDFNFEKEEIERFKEICNAEIDEVTMKQYSFAVDFVERFMKQSGIKDITFEKEDIGDAVLNMG